MGNPLMQKNENDTQQMQKSQQHELECIKNNPIGYLKNAGYNVPDNIGNNPMAIAQHLIMSGQVPKTRLTGLMGMLKR